MQHKQTQIGAPSSEGATDQQVQKGREESHDGMMCQKQLQSQEEAMDQPTISLKDYGSSDSNGRYKELYPNIRGLTKYHGLVNIQGALLEVDIPRIENISNVTQSQV